MKFFLLIALLFFTNCFLAQLNPIRNYTINDGLPSNSIKSIFRDSKGFYGQGQKQESFHLMGLNLAIKIIFLVINMQKFGLSARIQKVIFGFLFMEKGQLNLTEESFNILRKKMGQQGILYGKYFIQISIIALQQQLKKEFLIYLMLIQLFNRQIMMRNYFLNLWISKTKMENCIFYPADTVFSN